MQSCKVIFEDPQYTYITSVSENSTLESLYQYFSGKWYDMAPYNEEGIENWQKCINVEIV